MAREPIKGDEVGELRFICRCGWEGSWDDVKKESYGTHPSGHGSEFARFFCPLEGDGRYHKLTQKMLK